MAQLTSVLEIDDEFSGEEDNSYNTLGGFVVYVLGRVPAVADNFESSGCHFMENVMPKILTAIVASMFTLSAFAAYAPKTDTSTVEVQLTAVATAKAEVKQSQTDDMLLAKKGGKKKKNPKPNA